MTATAAAARIAAGELSVAELCGRIEARIEETEGRLHAYVHRDSSRTAADVRAADSSPERPLRGVPFAVKDVLTVAGAPSRCGSRALGGEPAAADATAVRRLVDAGAVLLGKQATHELTCGLDEPPTRNAWDTCRYPGGSSAGAGVSVAAGSALVALGTDAAGSVRIPAALNGVVGLKPTFGRVSAHGVVARATAPSIDHVGIVTRTVEDLARVLDVVAGFDPLDPGSLDVPVPNHLASLERELDGARIGLLEDGALEDELEHGVAEVVAAAYRELERLGAKPVTVRLPSLSLARQAVFTIFPAELGFANKDVLAERAALYQDGPRRLLELGLVLPVAHLQAAWRLRDRLRAEMKAAFRDEGLTAVASPTVPRIAMPLTELDPARDLGGLVPYTCPFNLTGQPALTVPCGFADGLPVGLQLAGRPFDEESLLAAGHAYQRATDWHERRPSL